MGLHSTGRKPVFPSKRTISEDLSCEQEDKRRKLYCLSVYWRRYERVQHKVVHQACNRSGSPLRVSKTSQSPTARQRGQTSMHIQHHIPLNLPQPIREQLNQMTDEQLHRFVMSQRQLHAANPAKKSKQHLAQLLSTLQQTTSEAGKNQATFDNQTADNPRTKKSMIPQQSPITVGDPTPNVAQRYNRLYQQRLLQLRHEMSQRTMAQYGPPTQYPLQIAQQYGAGLERNAKQWVQDLMRREREAARQARASQQAAKHPQQGNEEAGWDGILRSNRNISANT